MTICKRRVNERVTMAIYNQCVEEAAQPSHAGRGHEHALFDGAVCSQRFLVLGAASDAGLGALSLPIRAVLRHHLLAPGGRLRHRDKRACEQCGGAHRMFRHRTAALSSTKASDRSLNCTHMHHKN